MINKSLLTPFAKSVGETPLNVYPRPQLERALWQNLNGTWDFSIEKTNLPFDGYKEKIRVPFSPESVLSGVDRILQPDETAYYKKSFSFKREKETVLLHFGAVDYKCNVRLNGQELGSHEGGYYPFTFDITDVAIEGENILEVAVIDPTDTGRQGFGKQSLKRGGIWYTPQSGIWQTVWIEQTNNNYVREIRVTPDVDKKEMLIELVFAEKEEGFTLLLHSEKGEKKIVSPSAKMTLDLSDDLHLWSPEGPYLYYAEVETTSGDLFNTYFAMRKISVEKRGKFPRILLNNKPYFQKGLLDQGYWCDGLYTAPSDEAMVCDIIKMKEMGFNMLRKHIKVEPLRWYYHCDRLGMLVWQDIVSGGRICGGIRVVYRKYEKFFGRKKVPKIPNDGKENYEKLGREDAEGRRQYKDELVKTIRLLYNTPSIIMWVTFNEAWGQFDSREAVKTVEQMDATRLIDHASGWFDQNIGSVNSLHNYYKKPWYPSYGKEDKRALVLSECGGLTYAAEKEHLFDSEKICGYRGFKDADSCTDALVTLLGEFKKAIDKNGLCAYVYTQVSDVEEELNGLLTYDRKVVKVDPKKVKDANDALTI